jgi:cytochrome c5
MIDNPDVRTPQAFARRRIFASAAMAFVAVVAVPALAQQADRTGKQVVESLCISCHGSGANGAPRIGDNKAWAARASAGLTGLTQHALDGIRQMPPHGGNPNLSDVEIARAITYMVNRSGGHWTEPISRTSVAASRTGAQIVDTQCSKCHAEGVGGAPRIGDRPAWIKRETKGLDYLVRSAINGHGGMPPRGGMANLTDAEIRGAIVYMMNYGAASTK